MTADKYSKQAVFSPGPASGQRLIDTATQMPRLLKRLISISLILLPASGALGQAMPGVSDLPQPASGAPGDPAQDGGWVGLAKLLDAMRPGVDTAIPPSASEITRRIETLLNAGQNQEALTLINQRLEAEKQRHVPGTDVQLAFQHARALAATGDVAGAERIYDELTVSYPELPEPWNNLASIYVQRGQLDRAYQALQTALLIKPGYGVAQANLADVHLMLAKQAYAEAAKQGVPGASKRERSVRNILESQ